LSKEVHRDEEIMFHRQRSGETVPAVAVAESLTKRFGGVVAVEDLSFALPAGTITGFLGPNGAGKTTTLRMLLGLSSPSSGRALVFDRPYATLHKPALRIGAVLEATDFHPGRSGRDHLRMLGRAVGLPDSRADEALALVELASAARRRVKGYSLGMRQRLGLAAALLGDPELLVLDEPANGLDPEGVRWLRDFLRSFASEGRTVLISSHVLAEVAQTRRPRPDHQPRATRHRVPAGTADHARRGTRAVRAPRPAGRSAATRRPRRHAKRRREPPSRTRRHGRAHRRDRVRRRDRRARARQRGLLARRHLPPADRWLRPMIAQIRAELFKVRSTRTTIGLVLGMIALILLFSLLTGLAGHRGDITGRANQLQLLNIGNLAGAFSAIAGLLLVTSEYRHGTIRPTVLFTPARPRVLAAKLLAATLTGVAFGAIGEGLGWATGYVILRSRGIPLALSSGDIELLGLGALCGVATWAAIGAGVGAIIRNQVAGIITLLAWGFIIDKLLHGYVPSIGRFTPTRAADALSNMGTPHLLSPVLGGLVLLAWIVLLTAIALPLGAKRDIA
jgi:ABC-2 type transport system ATP-binding protein